MVWEALGASALGLLIAWAALQRLPRQLPNRPLAYATGPAAALLGGLITRIVVGSGHTLITLTAATGVSVAILSLLLGGENGRPRGDGVRAGAIRAKVASPPRA